METALSQFLLGVKPKDLASKAVIVPFLPLKDLKKEFTEIEKTFSGRSQIKGFTGIRSGQRISVFNTGVGASLVGDLLLWLKGIIKQAVLAGSAGALSPGLNIGDYFLPVEAVDGEGFSQYYLQNPRDNFRTAARISVPESVLGKCSKLPVATGAIYSTGSLNAEDVMLLELLKSHNISALDMETSAFYTAAQVAGIEAVAFHYISDLPLSQPFYKKLNSEDQLRLNYALEGFPRTVLDVLNAL